MSLTLKPNGSYVRRIFFQILTLSNHLDFLSMHELFVFLKCHFDWVNKHFSCNFFSLHSTTRKKHMKIRSRQEQFSSFSWVTCSILTQTKKNPHVSIYVCKCLCMWFPRLEKFTSLKYSHNKYWYNVFHLLLCMHTNERIMYERYILITWVYLLDTIETPFRLLSSSDSSACCRGMFTMFDFLTFLLLWTIHSNIFFIIKNSCTSLCCYSIFFIVIYSNMCVLTFFVYVAYYKLCTTINQ